MPPLFYTTNMNFITPNKHPIGKLVSARASICRGQATTLAKLYAGVSYQYGSGTSVTNNGALSIKGGLPWGLLKQACCGYDPVVILAGATDNNSPNQIKPKSSKHDGAANATQLAYTLPPDFYKHLQLLNPTLVLDAFGAYTFWLKMISTTVACTKGGSNILASIVSCNAETLQVANGEDYICLPSIVALLKQFLPKANAKFSPEPYFVGINCPQIAPDCDFYITNNCYRRLSKLKFIKQKVGHNLTNLYSGQFDLQILRSDIALQIINSITFTLNKTTLTENSYFMVSNRSVRDIKSFSTIVENKNVFIHCLSSDNQLRQYISSKTKQGSATNIVVLCPEATGQISTSLAQSLKEINLQLAKIEYLSSTAALAPAFGHILRSFIFNQSQNIFSGHVPRFITQHLHAISCKLANESGKIKSLAEVALKQGDWAASVALESIAQKQLSDASDCMQYLFSTDDFQTSMIELMETQKSLIAVCKSLASLAKLHNLESVASTASLILSHGFNQLDILTNLCLKATIKSN